MIMMRTQDYAWFDDFAAMDQEMADIDEDVGNRAGDCGNLQMRTEKFIEKVAIWAVFYRVTHSSLYGLLKVLNEVNERFPKSVATLLKSMR